MSFYSVILLYGWLITIGSPSAGLSENTWWQRKLPHSTVTVRGCYFWDHMGSLWYGNFTGGLEERYCSAAAKSTDPWVIFYCRLSERLVSQETHLWALDQNTTLYCMHVLWRKIKWKEVLLNQLKRRKPSRSAPSSTSASQLVINVSRNDS